MTAAIAVFSCGVTAGGGGGTSTPTPVTTGTTTGPNATMVYGQGGSFVTATANNGGVSANSLASPYSVAVDAGGVYIADYGNGRVLYYPAGSTTATRVYGQGGNFTTNSCTSLNANTICSPNGVAVDAGGVYIADYLANRVLYYAGTSTTATRVYGQLGSFTTAFANNGGVSPDSLNGPIGIAVDAGGVYIADSSNSRVLYYAGISTTATRVYGQGGSFTTNTANNGGLSANSLDHPFGLAVDTGGLYIADYWNSRVLYYSGASTTATRVYGRCGSFTGNNCVVPFSADTIGAAPGVAVDAGGVYIADFYGHRVLYYPGISTTATRVYGQEGSFTTIMSHSYTNDGITFYFIVDAASIYNPSSVAIDSSGSVYVVDFWYNRVLKF